MTLISLMALSCLPVFANSRPMLRSVSEARKWLSTTTQGTADFSFSGQALTDTSFRYFILRDGVNCQIIEPLDKHNTTLSPGNWISVTGTASKPTSNWSIFLANKIDICAKGTLPPPTDVTADELANPILRYNRVRVNGVVCRAVQDDIDANYNWILLRTKSGTIRLAVRAADAPLAQAKSWIDAEMSAIGFVMPFEDLRKPLGFFVVVHSAGNIVITRPAPPDPFQQVAHTEQSDLHRQRRTGYVRAISASRFFVKTAKENCLQIQIQDKTPPCTGQWLDIVGFPNVYNLQPQFNEALWRYQDRIEAPDQASPIDLATIFTTNSENAANAFVHQKIIRLKGTAHFLPGAFGKTGVFSLTHGNYAVHVDASGFPDAAARVREGAIVDVSGLCLCEFRSDAASAAFPEFDNITVILRSADELKIVRAPPWWTLGKLLVVVAVLIAVIIGILVWNRSLQRLSEFKGLKLSRERFARLAAQLKAEERKRLSVELHDSIAQTLTGVAITVNTVRSVTKANGTVPEQLLDVAANALKSCREDIRNCLWELRNNALEASTMDEAISRTLAPHTRGVELSIRFNLPRPLFSDNSAHTVLCIIRELTINAVRHGNADHIWVAGTRDGNSILFSVRDNGCGFDPENRPDSSNGHFGLQGVSERLAPLNGTFVISSTLGKGTKISVTIPIPAQ